MAIKNILTSDYLSRLQEIFRFCRDLCAVLNSTFQSRIIGYTQLSLAFISKSYDRR